MIVSIRLNLLKAFNKLTVRYNTFEKVSYDKYFIASLILNTKKQRSADGLIDKMTGNGSLNEHFKKLYLEVRKLSTQELEAILKDSLYPIQKIEEYNYTYIPMLDISIFEGNISKGNLKVDEHFPKILVEEGGTYVSHTHNEREAVVKPDYYEANLTDKKIEIIFKKEFYQISEEDFQSIIIKDDIDFNGYKGNIAETIQGNEWIQLSRATYNNIIEAKDFYYENGDHFAIYNDNVKKSSLAYSWGLYWVKEKTFKYQDSSSQKACEKVAEVLMKSGRINEFKTKSLLDILKNINRDTQQEIINYILKRKESKDIAMVGFILIGKGYEKGWSEDALKSFYKFKESNNQLMTLYKINSNLSYTISDLLDIYKTDKTILSATHCDEVKIYFSDCDSLRKRINERVGEVSTSGIRENYGKMPLDGDTKKFRKMINEIMAHFNKNMKDMDLNQLKQFDERIDEFYNLFKVIQTKWQAYQDKID